MDKNKARDSKKIENSISFRVELPYLNAPIGISEYDFELESEFFTQFGYEGVFEGRASLHAILNRHSSMGELEIMCASVLKLQCSRCMGDIEVEIDTSDKVFIKNKIPSILEDLENEEGEKLLSVSPSSDYIDITKYVFDSIILSLPYNAYHGMENGDNIILGECDEEVLKFIDGEIESVVELDVSNDDEVKDSSMAELLKKAFSKEEDKENIKKK